MTKKEPILMLDNKFEEGDKVIVTSIVDRVVSEITKKYTASVSTRIPIRLDPKATATGLYKQSRKWIRRGDLVIDEYTGDYIPVRKLTKEQLDLMFKKDLT